MWCGNKKTSVCSGKCVMQCVKMNFCYIEPLGEVMEEHTSSVGLSPKLNNIVNFIYLPTYYIPTPYLVRINPGIRRKNLPAEDSQVYIFPFLLHSSVTSLLNILLCSRKCTKSSIPLGATKNRLERRGKKIYAKWLNTTDFSWLENIPFP